MHTKGQQPDLMGWLLLFLYDAQPGAQNLSSRAATGGIQGAGRAAGTPSFCNTQLKFCAGRFSRRAAAGGIHGKVRRFYPSSPAL